MFNVNIDLVLKVKGCPESGLGAVDFRSANGLPAKPTSEVRVKRQFTSETLCRQFPQLLGSDADIVLQCGEHDSNRFNITQKSSCAVNSDPAKGYMPSTYDFAVPAKLLVPLADRDTYDFTDEPHVAALLTELLAQTAALKEKYDAWQAERRRREAAEQAERQQTRAAYEAATKAEAERKAAKKAAQEAAIEAWAETHGSDRLKACVQNEWECDAVYKDERLALELPEWQWDGSHLPKWGDPRNPLQSAIDLFAKAKATLPADCAETAALVYWTHEDDDGNTESGYAVVARPAWADDDIVYGYTGPEIDD